MFLTTLKESCLKHIFFLSIFKCSTFLLAQAKAFPDYIPRVSTGFILKFFSSHSLSSDIRETTSSWCPVQWWVTAALPVLCTNSSGGFDEPEPFLEFTCSTGCASQGEALKAALVTFTCLPLQLKLLPVLFWKKNSMSTIHRTWLLGFDICVLSPLFPGVSFWNRC